MKLTSILLTTLLITGCAGMKKRVDNLAAKNIKKVAIVGYTMDYKKSMSGKNILNHLLTGSERDSGYGKIIKSINQNNVSKETYDMTAKKLRDMTGWNIVPYKRVIRSSTVARLYEKKNKTIQTGVLPLRGGSDRLERKRIPQHYYIQQADIDDKRRLAKELGVDAIVSVYFRTKVNQFSLLGIGMGSLKYQTETVFEVIEPYKNKSIVWISELGDEITDGEAQFMGFNSEDDHQVKTYKGVYSSFDQLLNELKTEI